MLTTWELGHDVKIHKHFYRLQESTVELCKVSKLLLAIDRGEVGKWSRKTLDEIDEGGDLTF